MLRLPFLTLVAVVVIAPPGPAQSWQMTVSVRASTLTATCGIPRYAALPTGPVTAPVMATAAFGGISASSAITPQTPSAPPVIDFGINAYPSLVFGCQGGVASGGLVLDLMLTAPTPGPAWLRVVWDGTNRSTPVGVWTLTGPGGLVWREHRETTAGFPPYVDVPVDTTTPVPLTVNFTGTVVGSCSTGGGYPQCFSMSAAGRMTFALRRTPPMQQEIYGAPCSAGNGYFPAAAAYDPFGVPGHAQIEAGCSNFMRAPLAVLCVGSSRDRFGPFRLPLDLGPFGAPGCELLTDMVVMIPVAPAPTYPTAQLATESVLRGLGPVYCQWFLPDSVNPMGLIFSNGVRVEVP